MITVFYVVASKRSDKPDESEEKSARPRRRAAKKVSNSAYVDDREELPQEYADSPSSEGDVVVAKGKGTRGKKRKLDNLKVPRIKIKLIGRSDENDSPIFFAEPLEEVCSNDTVVSLCVCVCAARAQRTIQKVN